MDERDIVSTGGAAAESVVFSRYSRGEVSDIDITIRVEDMEVEIDIYLSIPSADDEETIARDAALAAQHAIDELLEEAGGD